MVVVPLQDVLGLGNAARMNMPGTPAGNWSWRATRGDLNEHHAMSLHGITEIYGRLPEGQY
jgi:4-alpha-glucanotransferase